MREGVVDILNSLYFQEQTYDGKPNNIFGLIDHREVIGGKEAVSVSDRFHTDVRTDVKTSLKPSEETEEPKEEKEEVDITMCANIEDKEEMIRCKLIACWKDNQYCF